MLDRQRLGLTEGVAVLLNEGAATYWELEHLRLLWGATRDELIETLHNLDTQAAHDYETEGPRLVWGPFTSEESK